MSRDAYKRDIPAAAQASDFGLTGAEVFTSLDGFTKNIDIYLFFDTESISVDQLKKSLSLVSDNLGGRSKSTVLIVFCGPDRERMAGFEVVTNELNDELQLVGSSRMDGESAGINFDQASNLYDLVAQFGEG